MRACRLACLSPSRNISDTRRNDKSGALSIPSRFLALIGERPKPFHGPLTLDWRETVKHRLHFLGERPAPVTLAQLIGNPYCICAAGAPIPPFILALAPRHSIPAGAMAHPYKLAHALHRDNPAVRQRKGDHVCISPVMLPPRP